MEGVDESRIGILGGTFNPVHLGHLILAQNAIEAFNLGLVLFVPCAEPPHKDARTLAAGLHRRAMLEAAVEGDPRFEVSDVELQRGGVSYTIDTIGELAQRNPNAALFFLIGDDTLPELHLWKDIYSLLALCRFATFCREHVPGEIAARDLRLAPPWPERLMRDFTPGRRIEISSSDIRHRVAEGLSIRYLVPEAVEMYIAEHGLYQGGRRE
jgi:nicotinate-nucleotide adenylyltransferase